MNARRSVSLFLILAFPTVLAGQARSADSAAVVATIERFHKALTAGDSATVLDLLATDVSILETGRTETREQYRSGHMRGDMAYTQAVPGVRTMVSVNVQGDAAWVVSTSVSQGTYRERPVNSAGAELMVLRRTAGGWQIVAIHWSSRSLTRAP